MASTDASTLKKKWAEMPEDDFETLTFGELGIGKKFIGLPTPGDNHGHGGLRTAHWLFEKTKDRVEEVSPGMPYSKECPHGVAINITTQVESHFPLSMDIILIG